MDEELQEASDPNELVWLRDPESGVSYQMPAKLVPYAAEGHRQETEDEATQREKLESRRTVGGKIQTFVEQGVDEALFNIPGAVAANVAPDYFAETEARREANPGAATAGRVVGFAAPIVATLGAGAGAKAAGTGVRAAIRGAAEAAPINLVSRLGSVADNAAGAGLRALGVTGESVAGRALSGGVRAAAAGATEAGLMGGIREAANAAKEQDWDHLGERALTAAGRDALFGGGVGGLVGAGLPVLGAATKSAAKIALGEEAVERAAMTGTATRLGGAADDVAKLQRGTPEYNQYKALVDTADEYKLAAAKSREELATQIAKTRSEVAEKLSGFNKRADDLVAREPGLAAKVDDIAETADPRHAEVFQKLAAKPVTPSALRRAARDVLEGGNDEASVTLASVLNNRADETVEQLATARPKDVGEQSVLATARADDGALELAEQLAAKGGKLSEADKFSITGLIKEKLTDVVSGVGKGALNAVALSVLSGGAIDPVAIMGFAVGNAGLQPRQIMATLGRQAVTRSAVANRFAASLMKSQRAMERSAREFVNTATSRPVRTVAVAATRLTQDKPAKRDDEALLRDTSRKLVVARSAATALASDPEPLAQAAGTKQLAAIDYLESTKPVALAARNPFSKTQPRPNPVDVSRWMRRVDTANNPTSVLGHMKDGTLTREHVETLQTLYPKFYEELKLTVQSAVQSADAPFNPSAQATLKTLFGLHNAEDLVSKQSVFTPPEPPPEPTPSSNGRSPSLFKQYETAAQKMGAY